MSSSIERARAAFARREWVAACAAFATEGERSAADHELHAIAAHLTGADDVCERAWEAAHRAALDAGKLDDAARYAFWLGLCLLLGGRMAPAGGWLARAQSLVDDAGGDVAASGYLLIPRLLGALGEGDALAARELAERAVEIAKRCGDADLLAFGTLGLGQALIALHDIGAGTARLDEVMVSVSAGEVGPITTGVVYCAVILECMALFDLQRAAQWTDALGDWCETQPDLVPYRGQCMVHRSQLQMVAGQWPDAIRTAEAACRRLTDPPHPALGLAYYQAGELHRLIGEFDAAEAAYRQASRLGHDPVPGIAWLDMGRGDTASAVASIRRALQESPSPAVLAAAAELLRLAGDTAGARAAAVELTARAAGAPSPVLQAMAAQAMGGLLLAEGDPAAALRELRTAARAWASLAMPYESARTAMLLALALAALGDRTAADLEFDNARAIFTDLGAGTDLARLDALSAPAPTATGDIGLSAREREVLTQLVSGKTNREIAAALHISQHTVGRHVENIFTKLGVTSRAAATARAYELDLVSR